MPNSLHYALVVLIWGSSWYVLTFQVGVVPAELSVAYRFALAAALLLGFVALRRGRLRFGLREHGRMAAQGFLNIAIGYPLVYMAAAYLPSGLMAVSNANMVFMTILFGALLFGQRLRARVLAGAVVGFAGMALIFAPDIEGFDLTAGTGLGLVLVVTSTAAAALGSLVAGSNQRAGIPVLAGTGYAMAYGAAAVLALALSRGEALVFDWRLPYVASLAYLAVFGSVVAFGCYFTLLGRIGADKASYATVLFPVVALAISTLLEGYVWTPAALAGAVLVLAGNLIATARLPAPRARRARRAEAAEA